MFVGRNKAQDNLAVEVEVSPKRSRSTNPVAAKQRKAEKEWEDSNIPIAFERDALRSISMTPGNHHNLLTA